MRIHKITLMKTHEHYIMNSYEWALFSHPFVIALTVIWNLQHSSQISTHECMFFVKFVVFVCQKNPSINVWIVVCNMLISIPRPLLFIFSMGRFTPTIPKVNFISPTMKINVKIDLSWWNEISFKVTFISGIM